MSKYYPHRQTVIIAVVSTLVVAGTMVYIRPKIFETKQYYRGDLQVRTTDSNLQNEIIADISNTDWKKAFIATSTAKDYKIPSVTKVPEKLTLTDNLSRDFFTRYVELKQNNLTNDSQSVQNAVNQTLNNALESAPQPKIYYVSNIVIRQPSDSVTLHNYGNNIASIFQTSGPRANPAIIASEALEKNDMNLLKNIKPVTASYAKMLKSIVALPVPQPLSSYHLDLVNALSSMVFVSQGLENISSDPVQSMIALNMFVPSQEAVRLSLYNMKSYFDRAGISFANTESGKFFSTVPQ